MNNLDENVNYKRLLQQQQTLLISSVNRQLEPESSYSPYIRDENGVFYIYVSELAQHTENMLLNNKASILFIQTEDSSDNIFARERAVFQCHVSEVEKHSLQYNQYLDLLHKKFGETVALLRSLGDFRLLALKPASGKYIAGFGKAYAVDLTKDCIISNED